MFEAEAVAVRGMPWLHYLLQVVWGMLFDGVQAVCECRNWSAVTVPAPTGPTVTGFLEL